MLKDQNQGAWEAAAQVPHLIRRNSFKRDTPSFYHLKSVYWSLGEQNILKKVNLWKMVYKCAHEGKNEASYSHLLTQMRTSDQAE